MTTRGSRNNNPFNIIRSKYNWLGVIPHEVSSDKQFEQFEDVDYGLRAGIVILKNFIRRNKDNKKYCTARYYIYRHAPASDGNDVDSYLTYICSCGIDIDKPLTYPSPEFAQLVCAICWYESRLRFSPDYIYKIIERFHIY